MPDSVTLIFAALIMSSLLVNLPAAAPVPLCPMLRLVCTIFLPLTLTSPVIFVLPSPLTDEVKSPPVKFRFPALDIPSAVVTLSAPVV